MVATHERTQSANSGVSPDSRPDLTTPEGVKIAIFRAFITGEVTQEKNRHLSGDDPQIVHAEERQEEAIRNLLGLIPQRRDKLNALRNGLLGAQWYWEKKIGEYKLKNQRPPEDLYIFAEWRIACIREAGQGLNKRK